MPWKSVLVLDWGPCLSPWISFSSAAFWAPQEVSLKWHCTASSLCFVVAFPLRNAGLGSPWSLGHQPALILYFERSFERVLSPLLEPSTKWHDIGAHISTTVARSMFSFIDDSVELHTMVSQHKWKFNNSTLELSDGDKILRFKGMRIIRTLVNHTVSFSLPPPPSNEFRTD